MNKLFFFAMLLIWSITSFAKTCTVTSETLNLRETIGADKKILSILHKGDEVEVLEENVKKGWVKVRYNNLTGYVAQQHLSCYAQVKKQASSGVWICMGKSAEVYHNQSSCKGLKKCKADIITVKESEAKSDYGRRPCKICYH